MLQLFVEPTRVYLLDLFYTGIQFYLLLTVESLSLLYFLFLYLDLYVLEDDVSIS